jgi:hypothetical protein
MTTRLEAAMSVAGRWFRMDRFSRPLVRDPWFVISVALAVASACWTIASGDWPAAFLALLIVYWAGFVKSVVTSFLSGYRDTR